MTRAKTVGGVVVIVLLIAVWRLAAGAPDSPAGPLSGSVVESTNTRSPIAASSATSRVAESSAAVGSAPFNETPSSSATAAWLIRGRVVERPPEATLKIDPRAEGRPVEGVTVRLELTSLLEIRSSQAIIGSATSGKDGTFEFAVGPATTVGLCAAVLESEAWRGKSLSHVVDPDDRELPPLVIQAMRYDAAIIGTVTTEAGAPIVGATVEAQNKATTNDSGVYRLPFCTADGSVYVRAYAAGYAIKAQNFERSPIDSSARLDFVLKPAGVVEGIVRGSDGVPIAGAIISSFRRPEHAVTLSDGKFRLGVFSIDDAAADQVLCDAVGYLPAHRSPRYVDGKCGLDFVLMRGAPVRGSVIDVAGSPVPKAMVNIGPRQSIEVIRVMTNREGRFVFAAAPTGKQDVDVEAQKFARTSLSVDIPESGLEDLRLVVTAGRSTGGRIEDEAGRPIEGSYVSIHRHGESHYGGARADASGRFHVEGLPEGFLEGSAAAAGYLSTPFEVDTARDDLVIVLKRASRLAGAVIDAATRSPVKQFSLRMSGAFARVVTAPDGVWRTDRETLRPGETRDVEIHADGFAPFTLAGLVAELDPDPQQHVAALVRASVIGGSVITADGAPVAGAKVRAVSDDEKLRLAQNSYEEPSEHATTDAKGHFEVREAPCGRVWVRVFAPARAPFFAGPYTVVEGGSLTDLRIVLPDGASVTGVVCGADDRPLPGATIKLQPSGEPNETDLGQREMTAAADAQGRFAFRGLPPGAFTLYYQEPSLMLARDGWNLRLAAGQTTDVRIPPVAPCSVRLVIESDEALPATFTVQINGEKPAPGEAPRASRIVTVKSAISVVDRLSEGVNSFFVSGTILGDDWFGFGNTPLSTGPPVDFRIKLRRRVPPHK